MVVTCLHRASRPNVLNHIYRATVTEYVSGLHSNARSAQQCYPYRPDPPDKLVSCCVSVIGDQYARWCCQPAEKGKIDFHVVAARIDGEQNQQTFL